MAQREKGVRDLRKANSGRISTKELNQRLKHKIRYLQQENEFLRKRLNYIKSML